MGVEEEEGVEWKKKKINEIGISKNSTRRARYSCIYTDAILPIKVLRRSFEAMCRHTIRASRHQGSENARFNRLYGQYFAKMNDSNRNSSVKLTN